MTTKKAYAALCILNLIAVGMNLYVYFILGDHFCAFVAVISIGIAAYCYARYKYLKHLESQPKSPDTDTQQGEN